MCICKEAGRPKQDCPYIYSFLFIGENKVNIVGKTVSLSYEPNGTFRRGKVRRGKQIKMAIDEKYMWCVKVHSTD